MSTKPWFRFHIDAWFKDGSTTGEHGTISPAVLGLIKRRETRRRRQA